MDYGEAVEAFYPDIMGKVPRPYIQWPCFIENYFLLPHPGYWVLQVFAHDIHFNVPYQTVIWYHRTECRRGFVQFASVYWRKLHFSTCSLSATSQCTTSWAMAPSTIRLLLEVLSDQRSKCNKGQKDKVICRYRFKSKKSCSLKKHFNILYS